MNNRLIPIFLFPAICFAQSDAVEITVDPGCVRNIGGVTEFDRTQFITVHESFGSTDIDDDDARYMEEELEACYGRDGGMISWQAAETRADPDNPEMPDVDHIRQLARAYRAEYGGVRMNPAHTREVILCTHPERMQATPHNDYTPWGPRTFEAAAEYYAQYLKHYWDDAGRPRYLEVLNEPFVHAKKIGTTAEAMSEQHNVVAKRVRELTPDVLIGGYTAAWVEVEARNFEHWNNWQKMFMDVAGANMDFFSFHIYDGVNVKGTPRSRTGSNSEAIIDLIDTYSYIKFGVAKPLVISEYGLIPEGNMRNLQYDPKRSAAMIRSTIGQLMTFMDHPDRLLKTVPFFLGKAEWTYTPDRKEGESNPFLLWRKVGDGYEKTDLIKFYQFWKGVHGAWRKSLSSNPDVRVHLLADGKRLTLVMINLDAEPKSAKLSGLQGLETEAVALRTLTTHGSAPELAERKLDAIPSTLELAPGESAMLRIDTVKDIAPLSAYRETRCYATEYLKDIEADKPIAFTFKNVPTGKGAAILRLSAGRENTKQVRPSSVFVNGKAMPIPTNWAGDDQAGRAMFFGVIEIPVPMDIVTETSTVEISYPDSGGKVACVVMQVNREI